MIVSMVKIEGMMRVLDGDKARLTQWKKKLSEGQVVQVNFTEEAPSASHNARKYFHLIRDAYARGLGYDREYAKDELCVGFGVAMLVDDAIADPPTWSGHVRELWGRTYFRKSTSDYTANEIAGLIEGSIHACIENDVRVEELVNDYRKEMKHADNGAA